MKKILNKKGYTLIEIIISMAIFSVVLVMITGFYVNFSKFYNNIETNSLVNTKIVNALNYIKYNIDETTYLEIVPAEYIEKNKDKVYNYILFENGKVISGKISSDDKSVLLDEEDINSKISLKFKKSNSKSSDLIVELKVDGLETINSYIHIQNMKYNNIDIIGSENVGIVYKEE